MQVEKLHSKKKISAKLKPKKGNEVSEDVSTGLVKRKGPAGKDGMKVVSINLACRVSLGYIDCLSSIFSFHNILT